MPSKNEKKKPLFKDGAGEVLQGMPRYTKTDDKSGMKEFEAYPGPRGITIRLYDKDVNHVDRYITFDDLAMLAAKK